MGVCTIGLKVWNKDGYGRREYVQREMHNLKLKLAIGKMKWYTADIKNSCFSTILSVITVTLACSPHCQKRGS